MSTTSNGFLSQFGLLTIVASPLISLWWLEACVDPGTTSYRCD